MGLASCLQASLPRIGPSSLLKSAGLLCYIGHACTPSSVSLHVSHQKMLQQIVPWGYGAPFCSRVHTITTKLSGQKWKQTAFHAISSGASCSTSASPSVPLSFCLLAQMAAVPYQMDVFGLRYFPRSGSQSCPHVEWGL